MMKEIDTGVLALKEVGTFKQYKKFVVYDTKKPDVILGEYLEDEKKYNRFCIQHSKRRYWNRDLSEPEAYYTTHYLEESINGSKPQIVIYNADDINKCYSRITFTPTYDQRDFSLMTPEQLLSKYYQTKYITGEGNLGQLRKYQSVQCVVAHTITSDSAVFIIQTKRSYNAYYYNNFFAKCSEIGLKDYGKMAANMRNQPYILELPEEAKVKLCAKLI